MMGCCRLANTASQKSGRPSSENPVFAIGRLCADFRPLSAGGLLCNPHGEPMPVYVPPTNQTPRSGGKTRSLGAVLGLVDQPSKRPVLFGRFAVPKLGFDARMHWLAKV